MVDSNDLSAWPSDRCGDKTNRLNILEFYHKILWNSQEDQCEIQKTGRRVTFSKDPPEIFEYASEYHRESTAFFTYQSIFEHRFKDDEYSIKQVLHHGYYNQLARSFNPIPNTNYHLSAPFEPLVKVDDVSSDHDLDPPPSYEETQPERLTLKRRISQQLKNDRSVVFIQKTLRKIKSTPRLVTKRSTVKSLHKKSSFS